jgi:hypothetical protein
MVERALALDVLAQNTIREWFVDGVVGQFPPHHSSLRQYWLQVAREGDRVGCELIKTMTLKENAPAVRRACQFLEN